MDSTPSDGCFPTELNTVLDTNQDDNKTHLIQQQNFSRADLRCISTKQVSHPAEMSAFLGRCHRRRCSGQCLAGGSRWTWGLCSPGMGLQEMCAFLREQTLVCSADSLQKGPAVPTLSGSMRSSEESGMIDHHRRTNVPRPWVLQMQGPVYVR